MATGGNAYDILSESVKYLATGLLGFLWWDIRKLRGMKEILLKEVREDFMSKAEAELRAKNVLLEQENLNQKQTAELMAYIDAKIHEAMRVLK